MNRLEPVTVSFTTPVKFSVMVLPSLFLPVIVYWPTTPLAGVKSVTALPSVNTIGVPLVKLKSLAELIFWLVANCELFDSVPAITERFPGVDVLLVKVKFPAPLTVWLVASWVVFDEIPATMVPFRSPSAAICVIEVNLWLVDTDVLAILLNVSLIEAPLAFVPEIVNCVPLLVPFPALICINSPPARSPAAAILVIVVNLLVVETALPGLLVIVSVVAVPLALFPWIVKFVAAVLVPPCIRTYSPKSKYAAPPEIVKFDWLTGDELATASSSELVPTFVLPEVPFINCTCVTVPKLLVLCSVSLCKTVTSSVCAPPDRFVPVIL